MIPRLPKLQRLNLHGIPALSDTVVEALSLHCPNLILLQLSSSNPLGGSSRLTDTAVLHLLRLPRLAQLNLAGCDQITGLHFQNLARSCRRLRVLNLAGLQNLRDEDLQELLVQGRLAATLQHLSLRDCAQLTDKTICMLIASQPRLQSLDLH